MYRSITAQKYVVTATKQKMHFHVYDDGPEDTTFETHECTSLEEANKLVEQYTRDDSDYEVVTLSLKMFIDLKSVGGKSATMRHPRDLVLAQLFKDVMHPFSFVHERESAPERHRVADPSCAECKAYCAKEEAIRESEFKQRYTIDEACKAAIDWHKSQKKRKK